MGAAFGSAFSLPERQKTCGRKECICILKCIYNHDVYFLDARF